MKIYSVLLISIILFSACSYAHAYEDAVYIWQRDWNGEIEESIKTIQPKINNFIVLGGDFQYKNNTIFINSVDINWNALHQKNARIDRKSVV